MDVCAIDITAEQRKTVLALLARHLPNTTAWVYGSRVKWTARPESDLDLVVFATPEQAGRVSDLREAFEESNLPFRVDLFVWDTVPQQFRKAIEAEHVVLVKKEEPGVVGGWREATLDQLGRIVTGRTPPSKIQGFFGGEIPFVTPTDLDGRRVIVSTGRSLTKKGVEAVYNSRIPARSVMVSCIGSDMGKTAIAARECVTNQQINSIVVDSGNEPLFVYYNLSNRKVEIHAAAGGSAQPILNKSGFGQFDILLPPPDQQRAIAHILGTLDDKIELNRRMNQTLEEMARALFKSWFIDFDPVRAKATLKHHEATPPQGGSDWSVERARAYLDRMDPNIAALFPDSFMDSELGLIPEGWEVGCFGDMVEQIRDKDHPLASPDAIFRHFSIPAFDENQWPKAERGENIKSQKSRVLPGVVLLSKLNPEIERVWLVDVDASDRAVCSTEFLVLQPRPPFCRNYSYCLTRSPLFRQQIESLVTGTSKSHQRAPASAILSLGVLIPPALIVKAFEIFASELLNRNLANRSESRVCSTLRDKLLPKLMSGKVRVMDEGKYG